MAQNISPELLKQLQDYYAAQGNANPFVDPSTGRVIQSNANPGWGQDNTGATAGTEFYGYDPSQTEIGQSYDKFNTSGASTGEGKFQKVGASPMEFAALLAALGAGAYGLGIAGPGGIGSGFGASAAGAGAGANGGLLSKAALDGTTAFGANSIPGAYSLGGSAASGGGLFNAAVDSQAANAAMGPEALSGYAGTGGVTASPLAGAGGAAGAAGGSSLSGSLKSLVPSGLSGLLGPAATAIGGLLGSKGSENKTTQTSQMNPALEPYLSGDGGLYSLVQQQLQKQMSPGYLQGYEDMRTKGQGLLNMPVAGNGFGLFYGKK